MITLLPMLTAVALDSSSVHTWGIAATKLLMGRLGS